MQKNRVFYQHPHRVHPFIFSGELPDVPVPNMHLKAIIKHYDKYSSFHFELVLRNNVRLSILRENGHFDVEIAQIINGKMTKTPVFDHEEFGLATIDFDLESISCFIDKIFMRTSSLSVIWGLDW